MRYVWDSQPDKALIRPSLSDPTYSTYLPYNVNEFAERRKFYTEYVTFWASFGIHIQEYVWNTSGIRPEYCEYGQNTAPWEVFWNTCTWNMYSHSTSWARV